MQLIHFLYNIYVYFYIFVFLFLLSLSVNKLSFNIAAYWYVNILYVSSIICILLCWLNNTYVVNVSYNFNVTKFILFDKNNLIQFNFNDVSLFFSTTTTIISLFVNVFSYFYNKNNIYERDFFLYLNYFYISMVFLIMSGSLVCMFFFWELIGLFSFLLINFYYSKTITFRSSVKVMSFNKLSDVSFLFFICAYSLLSGSFSTNVLKIFLSNSTHFKLFNFNVSAVYVCLLFLCMSAFVKSAQILLHFWLPDSMEAPLPASALIHSATLVAAGIFLFLKFKCFVYYNSTMYKVFMFYFVTTYFYGAVVASFQTDLKKLLAYSTISNCGLMFISFFYSSTQAGVRLFFSHGFFKSMSFLIIGQIISYNSHTQDYRNNISNSFRYKLNFCYILVSISYLSFLPFLSKSLIKHAVFSNITYSKTMASFVILSSSFSFIYSTKFYFLINSNTSTFNKKKQIVNIYELLNILTYFTASYFIFLYSLSFKSLFVYYDTFNFLLSFFYICVIFFFLKKN